MIARIKLHNYLNGLVFSLIEYLIVAAVLAPFLIFYVAHGWVAYGAIAGGVMLNCLTVCFFAFASIRNHEPSIGVVRFSKDSRLRKRIATDHPSLSRDTLILSVTVLVPFCIFGAVLVDSFMQSRKG